MRPVTNVLRVLGPRDLPEVRGLLNTDPVAHCFVASRVLATGLASPQLGGDLWGWVEDGRLVSLVYTGANMVPVGTTRASRLAFADRARRLGRRCSSLVGPADEVLDLWRLLEPTWGPAREVRRNQPLMAMLGPPSVAPDPGVRRVREDELDVLLPACVAMFTEEVGVSPLLGGAASAYRARIAEIIRAGRAFARIDDGEVVFKAEVGAATEKVCQVQGVWVDPRWRGTGVSAPGMAAVVLAAERDIAPVVSLYVNDYNVAARRSYLRTGFRDAGTFATVLF
jgi:predicted GNAT family acetyltransferase